MNFERAYERLNHAQKQAVDTIDGPLLVIAGPGTGKTQLLSARVANILKRTDTLPQNILCLTFTESGAENMRERLTRFIGQTAYDVHIGTYHSFGSDIIYRFPQYFTATQLQNPVDELGKHAIVQSIIDNVSYANPLKQLRHHLGDLISTISEVKRALLTSEDLRAIAGENNRFIITANNRLSTQLDSLAAMARMTPKAIPIFESIYTNLQTLIPAKPVHDTFGSIAAIAVRELALALEQSRQIAKTTPLTAWKNRWLVKDAGNRFVFDGELQNQRIVALADVFEAYQDALAKQGLYDFDDMIARAIEALEKHPELAYTLQEQYLYILLDEFQDTNAAQLRLVELLSDNPVHEGRPNIMAVGDDDQAIYAFQGAQYSNMLDFYRMYRDVNVINLTENYRSHAAILQTATNVAAQISARLYEQFDGMSKLLTAANPALTTATVQRQELASDVAHYDWIASQIETLIANGTDPREIAVLAPKHRYIEPLVSHLNSRAIAVRYEKRENILDAPVVKQIITMSKLVLALHNDQSSLADALWPEVLSFDFWQVPIKTIWQLSWRVTERKDEHMNWTKALLEDAACQTPALLFATLARKVSSETCETILDYLIGTEAIETHDPDTPLVRSPLRGYYTVAAKQTNQPEVFYETISHLRVLRSKLRDHQQTINHALTLEDFVGFIGMYEAADERMQSTSPYNQQANAVQLMTVFKSKGLEFEHVFLACCHDDVWGGSSRGSTNRLTLPANLLPIRHAGATDDERLRIFFVAITRAKRGLYFASYKATYSGKPTKRLKYLDEQEQADGSFKAMILPEKSQAVLSDGRIIPSLATLELDWRTRHLDGIRHTDLHGLLTKRLQTYQLSPTHLNQFIDTEHGGPEDFFLNTLLRFPQSPSVSGQFGSAMHETLEWIQHRTDEQGSPPLTETTVQYFKTCLLRKRLVEQQYVLESERGEHALIMYLRQRGNMFRPGDRAEHNFKHEGVFIGNVHLAGKIDRLEINRTDKTITIVDYKTGKPHLKWGNETKLHKYRQQLYCYKLLVEGSHTFTGYTVKKGRLEFVEPDAHGKVHTLELTFDDAELTRIKALMQAVWRAIYTLDFPSLEAYSKDLKGTLSFEADLLERYQA